MQKELFNQAAELFDTPEKWDAYLELVNQKEAIRIHYLKKVKQPLLKYFNENPSEDWICEPSGNTDFDMRWYLRDFEKGSLALTIGWLFKFVLHVENVTKFDSKKIDDLLKTDYSFILTGFDRIDRQFEHTVKILEDRNYVFGSPYDHHFNDAQLAWFAGNRTQDLVNQIIVKVERFTKDKEMTRMLYEVNQKAKI
jgi:hypothetical protein